MTKAVLVLAAVFAATAAAADITGNWKGVAETPNGKVERTFQFKQTGSNLTGETVSDMMGASPITGGKVEGDTVTFTITVKFQDNEMKLNYKGKIAGDEIKFNVTGADGEFSIDYVAKKTP